VLTNIVSQGASLVALGILVGVVGTIALARLLTSFLYGVGSLDPIALATASLVLLLLGIAAAFIPAHRASTVDPALVLREQ
jgi:ABC-type antimicrobial peptide transport system permease subunit